MLQQLFQQQQQQLNLFFKRIEMQKITAEAESLASCSGKIVCAGVGKSGLVAEKIAMTLVSTGTPAQYLSTGNALHGDIGIVENGDHVILMSRSGETEELIKLVPFLQLRGATVYAWVCKENSTLARIANRTLTLPMEKELCSYDLAPTTSAVIQMIVGDVIAVWLMQKKQFSLDAYQQNHPLGQIGKRIQLKVQDVMLIGDRIPRCQPNEPLKNVLVELTNKRCGCIVVTDAQNGVEGIFTDGDLRRALQEQPIEALEKPIGKLMTRNFVAVKKEERVEVAKRKMQEKKRVMMLPVVEQGALIGLLHMHDIIAAGI